MPALGQHKTHRPAVHLPDLGGAPPGHDMVALAGHGVNRDGDAPRVDAHPLDLDAVRLLELVRQKELADQERVHLARHPGPVAVPEQQVKGRRLLAHQIVVHHIVPQQVVGPQDIERRRHVAPVQVAAAGLHQPFQEPHLCLIDKDVHVARVLEILVGGEIGGRIHWLLALGRQVGQRHLLDDPAQAIAQRVDLLRAGDRLDHPQRLHHAHLHIVRPLQVQDRVVGVLPTDGEQRKAGIDQVLVHRVLRPHVHHIVLVDPGRDGQHRDLAHLLRGRRVLDQLDQAVAVDHLARRDRQVLAHLESAVGHHAYPALLQVRHQVLHALQQVGPAGARDLFQHLGVRGGEIGGAQRVGVLLRPELGPLVQIGAHLLQPVGHIHHPLGGDEIDLLHQVKGQVLAPGLVSEPPVFWHHLFAGLAPQPGVGIAHQLQVARRCRHGRLLGLAHTCGPRVCHL